MNDVGFSQFQGAQVPRLSSSSTGPVADLKQGGNNLPVTDKSVKEPVDAAEPLKDTAEASAINSEALSQAVDSMNDYAHSIERDLEFSVDDDLEQTVIKVIDSDSGDVIRQIPGDVFLELARNLKEGGEVRLLDALE